MGKFRPLTREEAGAALDALTAAIEEGHPWPPKKGGNEQRKSALVAAADTIGMDASTFRNRVLVAIHTFKLPFAHEPPTGTVSAQHSREAREAGANERVSAPADPVEVLALRDRVRLLSADLATAQRRIHRAESLRSEVFGHVKDPIIPVSFQPPRDSASSSEIAIAFLSDLHWEEVVDFEAMDGLNSYGPVIAKARLERWAHGVVDLMTKHWSGPPPSRLIIILGGDLITGEIHAELAKTNSARSLPAVRSLVQHLRSALHTIRSAISCPIDLISLPGNHGRTTMKPESKAAAETSYDILVSDFLEATLVGSDIKFYAPVSGDALFSVFGWRVMATHGDRIGSRGGQGYIGPAATAARGIKRIIHDYVARGVMLDLVLIGHFHTPLMLEEGFVNGSLIGPSEYSRDGRFRPHPAQQLFITMHPRRKIAQVRWIGVGHPDEGSIYRAPDIGASIKPRFSVRAATSEAQS